jgi:hypothetical protein
MVNIRQSAVACCRICGVKMTLKGCITMTEEKRFTLRMSQEIFNMVKEQAEKNKRSIAKEIEFILEQYFAEMEKKKE